jgi:hypothetical protein
MRNKISQYSAISGKSIWTRFTYFFLSFGRVEWADDKIPGNSDKSGVYTLPFMRADDSLLNSMPAAVVPEMMTVQFSGGIRPKERKMSGAWNVSYM